MSNPAVWQFSLNVLHAAMWGASLLVGLIVFSRFVSLRTLAMATLLATLALVMLGAYVRLTARRALATASCENRSSRRARFASR